MQELRAKQQPTRAGTQRDMRTPVQQKPQQRAVLRKPQVKKVTKRAWISSMSVADSAVSYSSVPNVIAVVEIDVAGSVVVTFPIQVSESGLLKAKIAR